MTDRAEPPEGHARAEEELARAVLVPAVMTMMTSGTFGDRERDQLENAARFSPIFRHLGAADIGRLIMDIVAEASRTSFDSALNHAAELLSPQLRETALCFAMRVAFADGRLEETEQASLVVCAEHFGIPNAQFVKMYEVLSMLQRPAEA